MAQERQHAYNVANNPASFEDSLLTEDYLMQKESTTLEGIFHDSSSGPPVPPRSSLRGSIPSAIPSIPFQGGFDVLKSSDVPRDAPPRNANILDTSDFLKGIQQPAAYRNSEAKCKELRTQIIDWHPARLLHKEGVENGNLFALLILNQPVENRALFHLLWEKALFRIAADGAGNRLRDLHLNNHTGDSFNIKALDVICGDLDSLEPKVRSSFEQSGTQIVHIDDQNSTDFMKCINYLRDSVFPNYGNTPGIICLGGLGGRVDHGLSQLHQLYMEQRDHGYKTGRIYLLTTEALTFVLLSGVHRIRVRDETVPSVLGKHIGIIPLKGPSIITTKGLHWDVTNWVTEFGGQMSTSNLVREDVVEITTTHDVLFTIDLGLIAYETGKE